MTDETLETVAEGLEDITIDSNEGTVFDGLGNEWSMDNPLPVQVVDPAVSSEDVEDPKVEVRYLGQETEADPVILEDINVYNAKSPTRAIPSFKNVWKLEINNQEYEVLFPENATLQVVNDKLYNTGTSNITGIILDSSFSDSSYVSYTITVLPVTASNTQTTIYRYGSRIYLTHYSVGTGNNLATTVSYVQPVVASRPVGFSFSAPDLVICGLLLLSVLVSIIGGLFRR